MYIQFLIYIQLYTFHIFILEHRVSSLSCNTHTSRCKFWERAELSYNLVAAEKKEFLHTAWLSEQTHSPPLYLRTFLWKGRILSAMICLIFLIISAQHRYICLVAAHDFLAYLSDSLAQVVVILGNTQQHIWVHLVCGRKVLAPPALSAMWCIRSWAQAARGLPDPYDKLVYQTIVRTGIKICIPYVFRSYALGWPLLNLLSFVCIKDYSKTTEMTRSHIKFFGRGSWPMWGIFIVILQVYWSQPLW